LEVVKPVPLTVKPTEPMPVRRRGHERDVLGDALAEDQLERLLERRRCRWRRA
jgi:hypothetical protein